MSKSANYPSLCGRSIFITGGASGIGSALVEAFYNQGAWVGFIDKDEKAAATLLDKLSAKATQPVWFRCVDVTNIPSLKTAVNDFSSSIGRLDVLINNVGNDTRQEPLNITENDWRSCMAVNLDAAFFATQTALKYMKRSKGGSIINISSINAINSVATGVPGYIAAKAGLLGLTKAFAREYGAYNIRVNSLVPGWVATKRQLEKWLTPKAEQDWMKQVALKKRILPEDIAKAALFLASDDSSMMTNQHIIVDGGRV